MIIGQRGAGDNVALIIPKIEVFHMSLSLMSNRPAQPAAKGGRKKKHRTDACYPDRFPKTFCDPPEYADPADGGGHRTRAIETHHPSDQVDRGQFLHDTPRDRGEGP